MADLKKITLSNVYAEGPCEEEWVKFHRYFAHRDWYEEIPEKTIIRLEWRAWLTEKGFIAPDIPKKVKKYDIVTNVTVFQKIGEGYTFSSREGKMASPLLQHGRVFSKIIFEHEE